MQARDYLIWAGFLAAVLSAPAAAQPAPPSHCYLEPQTQNRSLSLHCDRAPSLETPNPTAGFVALATSKSHGTGTGAGPDAEKAQKNAVDVCRYYNDKSCRIVETKPNTCLAVARSAKENILTWESGDGGHAGDLAIARCRQAGGTQCLSDVGFCSNSVSEEYISLAISGVHDQGFGWSTSVTQADEQSLKACRGDNAAKCQVIFRAARTCVAVSSSREGVLTVVADQDAARAQAAAMQDCKARGGKACEARLADCSNGRPIKPPPSRWASPLLLIVNGIVVVLSLLLVIYRALSARMQARPTRSDSELLVAGRAALLPVTFQTSRVRAAIFFAVALLILVPCTVFAFLFCAMALTGRAPISFMPFAAALAGGVALLWIVPKLLYSFGCLAMRPDLLTLSRRGLSIDGMRGRQEWQWSDITSIAIAAQGRSGKVLVLSLKDGVRGYNIVQLTSGAKFRTIRLGDFWETPSRFHAPEFLRDLIEPIWFANKDRT